MTFGHGREDRSEFDCLTMVHVQFLLIYINNLSICDAFPMS